MTTPSTSFDSVLLLGPEITLVLAALVAWLGGAFVGLRRGWLVAFVGIGAALFVARLQPAAPSSAGLTLDEFSGFIRWAVLALGGLLALVQCGDLFPSASSRGPGRHRGGTCEEAGTFLVLLAGLSLTGLASNLVTLFAGLELVSIPTYILLALKRSDARGQEATLKYFFLSLLASALFLYAIVCLYGLGGSTELAAIAARLREPAVAESLRALVPVALGMAIAAAAFRLAAVPMHFYAPDVYEGTSPGNAALLSTLPKVAGLVVLARLLALALPLDLFWQAAAVLAAVTMTVGNVMALWQRNLRRLLACSSIAHAGYLLVGVAVAAAAWPSARPTGPQAAALAGVPALDGMTATLFYLATYAVATIGLFGGLAYLGHRWPEWTSGSGPRPPREEIALVEDLDGLSSTNPVAAFAIALFLLSLAGIPPLPGFWGKLSLVASALQVDGDDPITSGSRRAAFVALAVILVLNAAIAAAYYLRIIGAIYFRTTKRGVQADGGLAAGVAMLACVLIVLMVALQPIGLFTAASRAGASQAGSAAPRAASAGFIP